MKICYYRKWARNPYHIADLWRPEEEYLSEADAILGSQPADLRSGDRAEFCWSTGRISVWRAGGYYAHWDYEGEKRPPFTYSDVPKTVCCR